jgi:hypothetical protein
VFRRFLTFTLSFILIVQIFRFSNYRDILGTALLLVLSTSLTPFSRVGLLKAGNFVLFVNYLVIGYAILAPGVSFRSCRDNKCSPINDGLFISFFSHENYLGMYIALSFFFYRYLHSRIKKVLLLLAASSIVLLTGSPVAMAILALQLILIILKLRKVFKLIALLPLILFAGSAGVFLIASSYEFTGRGFIYKLIRTQFSQNPFFGQDRFKLQELFLSGESNMRFLAFHEHGIFPFLVFQFGLAGVLLFTPMFILSAGWLRRHLFDCENFLPLALVSITFVSESILSPSILTAFSWLIVLTLGKLPNSSHEEMPILTNGKPKKTHSYNLK